MIGSKHQLWPKLIHPNGCSNLLNKTKVIIGSAENCDIVIDDSSISHYHALITIDSDGAASILDLESTNGTYLNGVSISKASLELDDVLSLGSYQLYVNQCDEKIKFKDAEQKVKRILKEELIVPLKDGLILIDDEYCDIVFNEQDFKPCKENPLLQSDYDKESFIDLDSWQTIYPIIAKENEKEFNEQAIRITTLTNGNILETAYLNLQKNKTYYASGIDGKGEILIDLLDKKDLFPMLEVVNGNTTVHLLPNFRGISEKTLLHEDHVIVMNNNSYQVFIELVAAPLELKSISNFQKEKQFYKDATKTFASILLPMLLLLLVDFNIPIPEKKLSIIYRKPMKSDNNKKVASKSAEKKQTTKVDGHKKNKQANKKLTFAKSGQKQKSKPRKSVKKTLSSSKTAKVNAYQFKMSNMNSLFAKSQKIAVKNSRTPSSISGLNSNKLKTDLNTTIDGTATGQTGRMGKDGRGHASKSFGTKGLTSIAGNDTAYIEPKTVVLGSMDPELLRKILQEYLPQFRHCYQQELVYNSENIKGVVDLNFEIAGSGKVSKIAIKAKDTRFSKRGTNCMAKVLGIIDFPKPKGGGRVAVRQPLNFFSEKERG